ncbi:MAG: methyltransferase, TIGR04325 family [Candidatus Binatia bacterium]
MIPLTPPTVLRRFAKAILPPALIDLIRGRPLLSQPQFTWQGIYSHLRDVPTHNSDYDDPQEVQKHVAWTRAALNEFHSGRQPHLWHEPLGIIAASLAAETGLVRILDFGGGVGSGFVHLLATLPNRSLVEYHNVDLPHMCEAGRNLFKLDDRIAFYTHIPAVRSRCDIVYANSVLQYVEDYKGLLHDLASLNARYILLARLAAGSFPTYATKQLNLRGKVLPYWFLNFDELVSILARAGYRLAYHGLAHEVFDQSNFPKTHRVGRMRNVLFVRSA